jgi:hypothetical protein
MRPLRSFVTTLVVAGLAATAVAVPPANAAIRVAPMNRSSERPSRNGPGAVDLFPNGSPVVTGVFLASGTVSGRCIRGGMRDPTGVDPFPGGSFDLCASFPSNTPASVGYLRVSGCRPCPTAALGVVQRSPAEWSFSGVFFGVGFLYVSPPTPATAVLKVSGDTAKGVISFVMLG